MAERKRMGFFPPQGPTRAEQLGLVIASIDPKEFIQQLDEARNEVKGSGSDRAELDASMIEDLADDLRSEMKTPIVTSKIINAVYRPGSQNKVVFPGQE